MNLLNEILAKTAAVNLIAADLDLVVQAALMQDQYNPNGKAQFDEMNKQASNALQNLSESLSAILQTAGDALNNFETSDGTTEITAVIFEQTNN